MGEGQSVSVVLPAHGEYSLTAAFRRPGREEFWVLAERFSGHDHERIEAARARWLGHGQTVSIRMTGHLSEMNGERFDSRKASVLISPKTDKASAIRASQKLKRRFSILGKVVKVPLSRPGGQILIQGDTADGSVSFVADDLVALSPYFVEDHVELFDVHWPSKKKGSRFFSGTVYTLYGPGEDLLLVNRLPAEDAVNGVVTAELYPDAPLEALKAQAVLARGQLLAHLGTGIRASPIISAASIIARHFMDRGR